MTVARLLLATALALGAAHAGAQPDSLRTRVGGYVGLDVNLPFANFSALPTVPSCCPGFGGGAGVGFAAGALVEFPLARKMLGGLRAGFEDRSATLTAREQTTVVVDGELAQGEFTHTLVSRLTYIAVTPFIGWHPSRKFTALVGLSGGVPLTATYDQREEITQPADRGTFTTGSRVRNASAGDLPERSDFDLALMFGASVDLPMDRNGSALLAPEITWTASLTPVVKHVSWNSSVVRAGVAVKVGSSTPDEEIPGDKGGPRR